MKYEPRTITIGRSSCAIIKSQHNHITMHHVKILLTTAILLTLSAFVLIHAGDNDARRLYIGDCVDALADHEGVPYAPQYRWELYASECVERYYNR